MKPNSKPLARRPLLWLALCMLVILAGFAYMETGYWGITRTAMSQPNLRTRVDFGFVRYSSQEELDAAAKTRPPHIVAKHHGFISALTGVSDVIDREAWERDHPNSYTWYFPHEVSRYADLKVAGVTIRTLDNQYVPIRGLGAPKPFQRLRANAEVYLVPDIYDPQLYGPGREVYLNSGETVVSNGLVFRINGDVWLIGVTVGTREMWLPARELADGKLDTVK